MAVKITTWILASSLYLLLVDWPSVDSCTYPPLIFALAAGHVSRYASLLRCDCRIRGGDTRLIGGAVGPTVVPLASLNMDHKHLLNHNAGRAASKQWSSMPCTPCLYLRVVGVGHGSSGDVDLFVAALPVKEILEHGTLSDRKATYPGKNEGV
ncbi:hypothetical protein PC129_g17596 [Phytophthora cactorum]|uniref:Uncharacterized protein n=1 Tax=Phytophthora cactorum TaxID=29920 RepID=A0A8T1K8L9_9STRA|nr:hypothetical protein PC113_g21822 [Phytophthora cactorum]KAG3211422.1 hypothetical protein PC129_g17596 [Phytophthora cactorum]KAG4230581.1 hypothetical protein PC116_g21123 [Phytophthora cactorum]